MPVSLFSHTQCKRPYKIYYSIKKEGVNPLNKIPTWGLVLVEHDGSSLLEYKVSVLCIFSYEDEACYKQLLVHESDNVVVVCEYLLEKRQLLRKVKEFLVKGTLLKIFS